MSVKSIKTVREGRVFRPADLFVYGALLIIILALFAAFVFSRSTAPLSTLYVDVGGERVLAWTATGTDVAEAWRGRVDEESADGVTRVTVYIDEARTRFNVIEFAESRAEITNANCSARKDCAHTAAIVDNGGVIICVPHQLKIYSPGDRTPSLG